MILFWPYASLTIASRNGGKHGHQRSETLRYGNSAIRSWLPSHVIIWSVDQHVIAYKFPRPDGSGYLSCLARKLKYFAVVWAL